LKVIYLQYSCPPSIINRIGEDSVKLIDSNDGHEIWSLSFNSIGSSALNKMISYKEVDDISDVIFFTYDDLNFGVVIHDSFHPYSIIS
jgi:hypothetical protein